MDIKTPNVSTVLSSLLTQEGISEAELGRKINVPRATINRLVAGRTPDPRASTLNALAKYFNISLDQLLGKEPLPNKVFVQTKISHQSALVHVLPWKKVCHWQQFIDTASDTVEYVNVGQPVDKSVFALKLNSEAMYPLFQENTILIIDPTREAKNRDFVIAHIHNTNDVIFRKLILEGSYKFLAAINPDFPKIDLTSNDKIIGVIIQTVKHF